MTPQSNPLLPFYRSYDVRADRKWRARVYAIAGGLIIVLSVSTPLWLDVPKSSALLQSWTEAYFIGTTLLLAALRLVIGFDHADRTPFVFHVSMLFVFQIPLFCLVCIICGFLADGFSTLPDQL